MATRIFFLLDKTGSMRSQPTYTNTIDGFNEWLRTMREELPEARFTMALFSSLNTEIRCKDVPFSDANDLCGDTYICDGWTPLFEAICKMIEAAEGVVQTDDKVIITILTDGEENCSPHPYSQAYVNQKVKEKQDAGWQFIFLGANMDAYKAGGAAGLARHGTMSYDSTNLAQSRAAFHGVAGQSVSYARGETQGVQFSDEDRQAAGDKFAESAKKDPGTVKIDLGKE